MTETHPPDHDLLIRLDEKVDGLIAKVEKLTNDHEIRIRAIEKYVWKAIGALAIIQFVTMAYISLKM